MVLETPISLMNNSNRDLLVLFNQELMTPQSIEHEVELLHEILYSVESFENIAAAHEAIDVNKYKIFNGKRQLREVFRQRELKPFVFLNCKN
jgi:hypothetical protein